MSFDARETNGGARATPHDNMLVRKLEGFGPLPDEDARLIAEVTQPAQHVPARTDIISEGDNPDNVHLILSGIACRYKLADNGNRQIVALFLPGDFCDLYVFILNHMDHSIGALTDCSVVDIPRNDIYRLLERPAIARALWWATLVDEAVLRERLLDIGRRQARERVAHLLSELHARMAAVGLTDDPEFKLRLTQSEIADALGLTNVSVNKVMMELRRDGIIVVDNLEISVTDPGALREVGGFSGDYLHLN